MSGQQSTCAIYRDALQRIVDDDPRDAHLLAAKAIGDANELQNTGTIQREHPLLRLLAEEGARRCAYAPGAGDPDKWPDSRCDCKYLGPFLGRPEDVRPNSELTGCCEIRAAYTVVKEHC